MFGAWSTSGCKEFTDDDDHTVCECSQLGHFGILFVSIECININNISEAWCVRMLCTLMKPLLL